MTATDASPAPLLEVRDLGKTFTTRVPFRPVQHVVAAEQVSFAIRRGEAVALVGESGSGKSTIGRLLLRLEPADAGEIRLDGVDMLAREPHRASLGYRRRVQMVFQDPFGSLNPVHDVAHHLARPLLRHGQVAGAHDGVRGRILQLLATVGLEPAKDFVERLPFELSGGQRQRVAIARALAVNPDLLVADEPTSMLDVSIRTGILQLLASLKRERGLAILLITHDLAAARYLADRILVLYRGRVVEEGPSRSVVESPVHPYTRALLSSVSGAGGSRATVLPARPGVESPGSAGCPFAPRCGEAVPVCREVDPAPVPIAPGRRVRCHLHPPAAGTPEA